MYLGTTDFGIRVFWTCSGGVQLDPLELGSVCVWRVFWGPQNLSMAARRLCRPQNVCFRHPPLLPVFFKNWKWHFYSFVRILQSCQAGFQIVIALVNRSTPFCPFTVAHQQLFSLAEGYHNLSVTSGLILVPLPDKIKLFLCRLSSAVKQLNLQTILLSHIGPWTEKTTTNFHKIFFNRSIFLL